jgi:hypothetical protein
MVPPRASEATNRSPGERDAGRRLRPQNDSRPNRRNDAFGVTDRFSANYLDIPFSNRSEGNET